MKRILSLFTLCALLLSPILALADTAQLDWTPNAEADLQGYKVYESTVSGSYTAPPVATLGKINTYTRTVPALTVDRRLFYTVSAYDAAGLESGKSNEVSKMFLALPGAPVLTVSSITTAGFIVTWPAVVSADGTNAFIDGRVFLSTGTWATATSSTCTVSPCTVTGLLPGTTYTVQAAAYRTPGSGVFGPLSAPASVTTLAINTPPAPPTGLLVK